jgi:hypothetical protein
MVRVAGIALIVASTGVFAGVARPSPSQDKSGSARIVAIADVHGAIDQFVGLLQAAGLIDGQRRWTGGRTRLVQTGDYFDRGAGVRDVMDLLMRLEGEARRAGGRVDVLMGNHEGMNLLHEFRDVSVEAMKAFADGRSDQRRVRAFERHAEIAKRTANPLDREAWMQAHPPGYLEYAEAIGPSGKYGKWLRARKVVLEVDGTIFMHAGISRDVPGSLDDINRAVEREIRSFDRILDTMADAGLVERSFTLHEIVSAAGIELQHLSASLAAKEEQPAYVTREFVETLQQLRTIDTWNLRAPEGPLWFRGYATWSPQALPQVQQLLTRFGAARFAVGHTPQPDGRITSRFNGRVFLIDTGMLTTHYKGGQPSALELKDGQVTAIYMDRREPVGSYATIGTGR